MNLKMPNSKSVENLDGLRVSVSFKNIPKNILPARELHPFANFFSDEWLEFSILENGLMTQCIEFLLDCLLWLSGWLNPVRVIGGVRKGIRPQLLLCSKDKTVPRPAQKKAQSGFLTGYGDFKRT